MAREARDSFVDWLEKEVSEEIAGDVDCETWIAVKVTRAKGSPNDYWAYTTIKGTEGGGGGGSVWGHGETPKKAVIQSVSAAFISLTADLKVAWPLPGIRGEEWSTTE